MTSHPFRTVAAVAAALALALAGSTPSPAQPGTARTPAGQIVNLSGRVEIRRASAPARPGVLLFPLRIGDIVRVYEGGAAEVALFASGARLALAAGSTTRVEAKRLAPLAGAPPRAVGGGPSPLLRRIAAPPQPVPARILGEVLRATGDPVDGPRDLSPNGAARAGPIILRWQGPIEGDQLIVRVRDGTRTIHEATLPATARETHVPEGRLRPGAWYAWSVTVFREGSAAAKRHALIRLLTPDERGLLGSAEQETERERAVSPVSPAPLLIRARLYERLGLFTDARSAYEAALRLRPGDPGVVAALKALERRPGAP